jgi:hypothetical protein
MGSAKIMQRKPSKRGVLHLYGVRFTEDQNKVIQGFAQERGLIAPNDIIQALCAEHFEGWPAEYPQHGGKREGAGRKRLAKPDSRLT